jgi:hypothetical protein
MDTMKKGWMHLLSVYACSFLIIMSCFVYPIKSDGEETTVSVQLSSAVVSGSETFTVSIYCEPGQPLKSFEFSVQYDESLINANSVSEGDIFSEYEDNTFFNDGSIDNGNGMISSVFDLIVGSGNVTDPGYLVNISFTAQGVSGSSLITLVDAGVTNETEYLPISVSNGSVEIDAGSPSVVDNSPESGTTGDSFTFNVSVSDSVDDSSDISTKVDWSHDGSSGNDSMVFMGGSYFEKTVTLDASTSDLSYTIYAEDTQGNSMTTESSLVSVTDNDDPQIVSDTSSASGTTDDAYSWFMNVSDNIDAEGDLTVKVDWSHDELSENVSMSYENSYWTYTHDLDDSLSDMTYAFYVEDSAGNTLFYSGDASPVSVTDNDDPSISTLDASPSTQVKDGSVNISCDVTDNIEVSSVYLKIIYPDSSSVNFSVFMNRSADTFYCLDSYSMLGSYAFSFWALDSSGNSVLSIAESFTITDQSSPVMSDFSVFSSDPLDTDVSYGWVNFSCTVSDDELNLVQLNYTDRNGVSTNASMIEGSEDVYHYNTSLSEYGNYSYVIWSNDTSGNDNVSSVFSYSLPPNWDVNNDGNVTVFDFTLISNQFGETGSNGWIREDIDNNGEIEVLDIVLSSNHYNEGWW